MAEIHLKEKLNAIIIKEVKLKTIIRYQYTLVTMVVIKKTEYNKYQPL